MSERIGRLAPWIAFILLLVFDALFQPGFLHVEMRDGQLHGALVDLLHRSAPIALLALGSTLAIAAGGVDLSIGSTMALASSVAAYCLGTGYGVVTALGAGLGAGLVLGSANGVIVASLRAPPILATLVALTAGRGLAQLLTGGGVRHVADPAWHALARGAFALPSDVVVVALAFPLLALLVHRSNLGLSAAAIGVNERAARLSGLPVSLVVICTYALSGVCAALAGVLVGADLGVADASQIGLYAELDAILAVVLGGTPLAGGRPRLLGSLGGALASSTLTTTLLLHGASTSAMLASKALLILVVAGAGAPRVRALFVGRGRDAARGAA